MAKPSMKVFLIWNIKEKKKLNVGTCRGFFTTGDKALEYFERCGLSSEEYEVWKIDLEKAPKEVFAVKKLIIKDGMLGENDWDPKKIKTRKRFDQWDD